MSTEPHEQEWTVDEVMVSDGDYSAVDVDGYVVLTAHARDDMGDADTTAEARIRFAAAAPKMARALLNLTASGHSPESLAAARKMGMAALKEAGVLS